ncbi:MAG: dihydroorotase [Candidatus Marinimicrobia bacterium]|nr:dihydroorotase [Candidatus Neomarinimicrobiota bacterium]MCF7921417.1 dihydroorotase [Candidatus Neomarinimicrobiota bacterium]
MPSPILIKNSRCVSSTGIIRQDVLLRDGKIAQVGKISEGTAARVIDGTHLYCLPGALDPQVHFRDPGLTWKEDLRTGSMAAAAGGVTSFFDMPNTKPSTITIEGMAERKQLAAEKCVVNYNFFIGATNTNLEVLNGVKNVPGIKIFMGSSTGDLLVSDRRDLENIFGHGSRLIAVHAEDDDIINSAREIYKNSTDFNHHQFVRSPDAALKATTLAVELAIKYQRRLHILHMTTLDEVKYLEIQKSKAPISAEVCPQHILLSAPHVYQKLGSYAQMNPPIRDTRHGEALWEGLVKGVIDCVATDHAPHTHEEKAKPFGEAPSGMPGVETSLPLMLDRANRGLCKIEDVVKWMCEKPVELYKVQNKGHIKAGYDADIVLVDMGKKRSIENGKLWTKVNWSPYDGWTSQGWPVMTIVNGNIVFQDGEIDESVKGKEVIIDYLP